MNKRVLITGGAGFIGSHIANLLHQRGCQVIVFDNLSTGDPHSLDENIVLEVGDVRDQSALGRVFVGGIDVVMHIAGQASIRMSYFDPTSDLTINTLGTVNVLQQCLQHRVPRLIFASSMTIYGNTSIVPTPEDTPPAPVSYYAVTKYAAERYVHLTAQRADLDFPFNVTSFRMFNVYGPGQSLTNPYQGVLAIFIGNVLRHEQITIHSDGEQTRDFVYIDDVARAWVDAVDNEAAYGQVINLGTGAPCSINRLCGAVIRAFDYSRERYPVHYAPAQPGDMRHSAADISRAKALLNWSPQVSLEQGMEWTAKWAWGIQTLR